MELDLQILYMVLRISQNETLNQKMKAGREVLINCATILARTMQTPEQVNLRHTVRHVKIYSPRPISQPWDAKPR